MNAELKAQNQICPICTRSHKARIKIRELENGKILISENCGFCRALISTRETTHEIERVRRDVLSLQKRIEQGDTLLIPVLQKRLDTYVRLIRNS
jgi:hypothetical protein